MFGDDSTFQRYVLQLLYYLVMTKIEKGILAIRYEILKDLHWIGRDSQGDHYVRSLDAKPPDMDCFQIILWTSKFPGNNRIRRVLTNPK
jgi:hypothetical protein